MPKDSVAHPQRTDGVRGIGGDGLDLVPARLGPAMDGPRELLAGDASLRDYFAAHAIFLFGGEMAKGAARTAEDRGMSQSDVIATCAYEIADAMLRERAKRNG